MPFKEIEFKDIEFSPEVQTFCNNPNFKCPNYGHSHACPPVAPYLEEKVSKFREFYLMYYKFDLDGYVKQVKAKHPKRSTKKIRTSFYRKNILRDHLEKEIENFINTFDGKYEEKLVLWDGFCRVCYKEKKTCTHDSGEPCRYQPRYSMEAVGINVDQTVRNANFEMEWPPVHNAYRFGLICFK